MNYYLMHKDHKVALLDINEKGEVVKVKAVLCPERLPVGIPSDCGPKDFTKWFKKRCDIVNSAKYKKMYNQLQVTQGAELFLHSYAVSMSDCYWIRPEPNLSKRNWSRVNFYDTPMSNDVSLLLVSSPADNIGDEAGRPIRYNTPNFTIQGNTDKFWFYDKHKHENFLFKIGRQRQTSVYSEVVGSVINNRLGLSHIEYNFVNLCVKDERIPCSVCESMFTDDSKELVTMQEYIDAGKTAKDILDMIYASHLEIPFYKMLVSDYILMNTDRSFSNFGFIRDSESLDIIDFAPLYDYTDSFYFDWPQRKVGSYDKAKPFFDTHEKQIRMVKDFSWYDDSSLIGVESAVDYILRLSAIPQVVQEEMKTALRNRIGRLNSYLCAWGSGKTLDQKL